MDNNNIEEIVSQFSNLCLRGKLVSAEKLLHPDFGIHNGMNRDEFLCHCMDLLMDDFEYIVDEMFIVEIPQLKSELGITFLFMTREGLHPMEISFCSRDGLLYGNGSK